jgi:outer membrane protein
MYFPSELAPNIKYGRNGSIGRMAPRIACCLEAALVTLTLISSLDGCAALRLNPDPELAPSQSVDRVWIAPSSVISGNEAASQLEDLRRFGPSGDLRAPSGPAYDLSSLVDLALRTNPQTRGAWYAAQAADAGVGRSQSANYPKIIGQAEGGFFKLPVQFPGQTLIIRNEEFVPEIKVTYDLLDFGRTRAVERSAREQLIAANYTFNRAIQDVVFNVEKSYYILSAAEASVSAAEANLTLAQSSLSAVQERHQMGLATQPQVLLATQTEAQAVYDLENAKSMVHDAASGLFETIGIAPDMKIDIQNIQQEKIPAKLTEDLELLTNDAIKMRPDIAAKIAAVRAGDAAIDQARSEFYPEVELNGNYGQIIWSYTVNGGHSQNLNQPFYGALLSLRWNLFTGFDRYYAVRKATAQRNAARSELKALQLDAMATVSAAYYDFSSARKKYEASETLVRASQESYNANLESHRHGLATITDLVSAERDLMGARYTLVQSKANLLVSSSALAHAVGAESASSARIVK